jgi:chromosome segregation ATPase
MSEIQTYNAHELIQGKKHREEVVLKADHLAALAEKEELIGQLQDALHVRDEQIAALTAEKTLWKATAGDEAEGLESWKKEAETLTARSKELEDKATVLDIEIDHQEKELMDAGAKIKELEAAQGKILKVCEPCGQEGIAEMEKLEQRIKELAEALDEALKLLREARGSISYCCKVDNFLNKHQKHTDLCIGSEKGPCNCGAIHPEDRHEWRKNHAF